MSDETVVVTCIQINPADTMAEMYVGVKNVDGLKYYRPATWAEVRKVECELPGWKGKLWPGDGPNVSVPFFSSKELY